MAIQCHQAPRLLSWYLNVLSWWPRDLPVLVQDPARKREEREEGIWNISCWCVSGQDSITWACLGAREAGNFSISALGKCATCAGLSSLPQFLLMLSASVSSHAIVMATPGGRSYGLHFMDETDPEELINLLKVPELATGRAGTWNLAYLISKLPLFIILLVFIFLKRHWFLWISCSFLSLSHLETI